MPAIDRPPETARRLLTAFGSQPVTSADAYALGLTRAELRAAQRRGLITSPRRGLVVASAVGASNTTEPDAVRYEAQRRRHVAAVRAALEAVGTGAFATHDSAALVHSLARPFVRPPGRVSLACPGIQDFTGPELVVRGSEIPASFVTVVDGIPITDLRRTAIDLARGRPLDLALTPLDHAARRLAAAACGADEKDLRDALLDAALREHVRREFEYAVHACRGWQGVVAAREAVAHLDPRSESPLESRSRSWFVRAGIRSLDIGVRIPSGGRTYWADFCSRTHRVIGEADGWSKYGATAEDVRAALREERRRQVDLERDGWRFVRWTSDDAATVVTARMRDALRSD